MARQSTSISEERIKLDELETYIYGTNSTEIYKKYREVVNRGIKLAMLDIAHYLEERRNQDKDFVSKILGEKYMEFYVKAEPILQTFYEELQNILKPPENESLIHKCISSKEAFGNSEVNSLEEEILELQEQYMIEKYYLEVLKQKVMLIDNKCLPFKEKIESVKTRNTNQKSAKLNSQLHQAIEANMRKYADVVSKEDIEKLINSDIELIVNS